MRRKLCIGALLILLLLVVGVSTVLGNGGKLPSSEESPLPVPESMPAVFRSPVGPPKRLESYWLSIRELTMEYFVLDVGDEPAVAGYNLWVEVCDLGDLWCRDMTWVLTDTYFTGELTIYWDDIPDQTMVQGRYVSWFYDCEPTSSWYACGFIDHWWIPYENYLPLVLRSF